MPEPRSKPLEMLLEGIVPSDEQEARDLARMRGWASSLADPFSRREPSAHFTGSAVVVSPSGDQVCLVLHRKLGRWLQPGGHAELADGGDLLATALREAREETGLRVSPHPSAPRPLDLDVHVIPARKDEPEHFHLDVRFLLVAAEPGELSRQDAEAADARWFPFAETLQMTAEPAFRRLLAKAARWAD